MLKGRQVIVDDSPKIYTIVSDALWSESRGAFYVLMTEDGSLLEMQVEFIGVMAIGEDDV